MQPPHPQRPSKCNDSFPTTHHTIPSPLTVSFNHQPRTQQLIHIRPLTAPPPRLLLPHQHSQHLHRRRQAQPVRTLPALRPRDTDAGPVLRGEVEVPEDLLVEGEALLVDCRAVRESWVDEARGKGPRGAFRSSSLACQYACICFSGSFPAFSSRSSGCGWPCRRKARPWSAVGISVVSSLGAADADTVAGEGEGVWLVGRGLVGRGGEVWSRFLDEGGREGLVTLLEWGPKARVCWACGAEGLRRVGGMVVWLLGVGRGVWWMMVYRIEDW